MLTALTKRHEQALTAAIKGEAYRLNTVMRAYARSKYRDRSPTARYFGKTRQNYGRWIAGMVRYAVDPLTLQARVGVIGRGDLAGMPGARRVQPVSIGFARSARKLASGFRFYQTYKRKRAMYAQMYSRKLKRYGGQYDRQLAIPMKRRFGYLVPSVGWHTVRARPVADPVARRERHRSTRNILRLYRIKMRGGRFKNGWAAKWGNH